MTKVLIALIGATVIGTGGYAAAAGLDDTEPARTVSLPGATISDDVGLSTGATADVTTTDVATTAATTTGTTTTVEDISGPCDEAEHANDLRCTGVGGVDDADNSGPGSGRDDDSDRHGHHGGDGDRSGSNSGSDHDDD